MLRFLFKYQLSKQGRIFQKSTSLLADQLDVLKENCIDDHILM